MLVSDVLLPVSERGVLTVCDYMAVFYRFLDIKSISYLFVYDLQALPGFLLVVTLDGKLVHVSDNVTDFLGHTTVQTF